MANRKATKKSAEPMAKRLPSGISKGKKPEERVAALAQVPLAVGNEDQMQAAIRVLSDKTEPAEVRMAALHALQAASFSIGAFESCRGDYRTALRKVAQDQNPELRQRALGLLARNKDGFAQKKLLEGLKDPNKALVPPEKALQLLSYDIHADAYNAAKDILANSPNAVARQEALRLLASDATAAPVFEKVMLDKNELRQNRQISAAALHAIDPAKMQEHARNIVLDSSDYDDIRATSLTALTQFGDKAAISGDKTLQDRVDQLKTDQSDKLKTTAQAFLRRYRT
jgi:HEAT repeat protein